MLHRWHSLSEPAQTLLLGMLEYDPTKRLTSKQVRQAGGYILVPSILPHHREQ